VSRQDDKKPIARPSVVLREEFDDWAVLFDPDTGDAYGLNPVGVFVWKHLDGRHSVEDIVSKLNAEFDDVPEAAAADVKEFAKNLVERGFAGYEVEGG
jgi:SynChlorMet cassette protein ScmD